MAQGSSALGVDISASAIKRARELARVQRVHNVTFDRADAQVCRSRRSASTWPSAGSAQYSSMTPWPRSPTSAGRCARLGAW